MSGTGQTSTGGTTTASRSRTAPPAPAGPGRRHVYLCPLRWSDMDAYQHVNNVVYLRYLEEARVDWMFRRASEAGVEGFATFGTVVAKHEIEYRRPLVYRPEPVRVEVWVTAIATAKFTVAYEVCDDDGVYATASSVLVPFNIEGNHLRRLSQVEKDYLAEYYTPVEA
ncbi:thioesterase superfamily protein [Catenulispora acidiphila DSM 44928]|uniref:Thioesterase superfamily protein n=1 Tax=Catenulispora acidiphila (strain DSM 44928 / JCM 14897 / NBRC 102108 / NRRL B-24433 / ID139908) TaxID=479433 RepID=C7Q9L6_CATAD|nr:acyl-CoA thioesterase [Catenulispora acidiphila]ACU76185.1 thioesterase superfamily protein [Catenulispora acidiphila DSM 44928]